MRTLLTSVSLATVVMTLAACGDTAGQRALSGGAVGAAGGAATTPNRNNR